MFRVLIIFLFLLLAACAGSLKEPPLIQAIPVPVEPSSLEAMPLSKHYWLCPTLEYPECEFFGLSLDEKFNRKLPVFIMKTEKGRKVQATFSFLPEQTGGQKASLKQYQTIDGKGVSVDNKITTHSLSLVISKVPKDFYIKETNGEGDFKDSFGNEFFLIRNKESRILFEDQVHLLTDKPDIMLASKSDGSLELFQAPNNSVSLASMFAEKSPEDLTHPCIVYLASETKRLYEKKEGDKVELVSDPKEGFTTLSASVPLEGKKYMLACL